MKCSYCQAEVNVGELFCGDCGRPITVGETRATPPPFPSPPPISSAETVAAPQPGVTKPVRLGAKAGMLAAVAAAFIVGAGGTGWVVLNMRSPAPAAAPAMLTDRSSFTSATPEPTIDAQRPQRFEQTFTVSLSSSDEGKKTRSTQIGAPSTDGSGRAVPISIENDSASPHGLMLRGGAKVDEQLKAFLRAVVPRHTKGENLPEEPAENNDDAANVLATAAEDAAEIRVLPTDGDHEIDLATPSPTDGRLFLIKRSTPLLASPVTTARVITQLPMGTRIQVSETTGDYYCVRDGAGNIAGYILRADLGPDNR